jgi:hypothetical protein
MNLKLVETLTKLNVCVVGCFADQTLPGCLLRKLAASSKSLFVAAVDCCVRVILLGRTWTSLPKSKQALADFSASIAVYETGCHSHNETLLII